jgi:nicotinate-nucleotide adenylyltransferase
VTVLFGGTFDPVHNAHMEAARAAAQTFSPERILFVPAASPHHKSHGAHASYEDRVRMLELACADEPHFKVSRIEQDFPRSYSILTIQELLKAGVAPLGFLIGADAFAEIRTWHRWEEVVNLVEFIVVTRPGAAYEVPPDAVVHELSGLNMAVSSSDVRARIERGERDVPVPAAVLRYIDEHGLYRPR